MATARNSPQTYSPFMKVYDYHYTPAAFKVGSSSGEPTSHAHPDPAKWTGPNGYGVRHMHDKAPFSLWSEKDRIFRYPTPEQMTWIKASYGVQGFGHRIYYLYIETKNPPLPIPLTLGCMPVLFVGPEETPPTPYPNAAHYANPRIQDPCPQIRWPLLSNPGKDQRTAIRTELGNLINMKAIIFLPAFTVVELVHGDGRTYNLQSLPGVVGGRTTLYHHAPTPFFDDMRDLMRERRLDPARYLTPEFDPSWQDTTNYLREPASLLTPGVRLSSGRGAPGTSMDHASSATSAGLRLRNTLTGQEVLTVANHGFMFSHEVYHPSEEDGVKIGEICGRRPELDVAFVKLTPSEAHKFSNHVYFQAQVPSRLVSSKEMILGSWSEVDGMSTGLVSLLCEGIADYQPERPLGHPATSSSEWQSFTISQIFGATNDQLMKGMCGAPIVECDTGNVQGFFHHLGNNSSHARSATLNDLIAEKWALV